MYSIPVIKVAPDGSASFLQGALHPLPPELTGPQRINTYLQSSNAGWSKTVFGYESFSTYNDRGVKYIFPAIYLCDGHKPSKKFMGYKAQFKRSQIEYYAAGIVRRETEFRVGMQKELNSFVHDLRRLSSTIYHQAVAAQKVIPNRYPQAQSLIQSVIASQRMLKLRTDVLDRSGSPIAGEENQHIFVYKKIDKVAKCFKPMAAERGINVNISGSSHSMTYGPDVLEIVFYVIIDNAVKYSPTNGDINIKIDETDDNILVHIESIGPTVEASEVEKIFQKGYRGVSATSSNINGSGLGLSLASDLIDKFEGKIKFSKIHDEPSLINVMHSKHYFTIEVPIRQSMPRRQY